ncbi:MAG: dihydrolipoamide acetyltransferase family protein, partial [Chthonomonadales bacterium]
MAQFVNMPTLGQSMEEGSIVQWFMKEGDTVSVGDKLVEIMSDKANFEVEAEVAGTLLKILHGPDSYVPVNQPIAIMGASGEDVSSLAGDGNTPATEATPITTTSSAPAVKTPVAGSSSNDSIASSPRARRSAENLGIAIASLAGLGTGVGGRIVEADVLAISAEGLTSVPKMTPLATRMVDDLGIDPGSLALGLPGSRINANAVRQHVSQNLAPAPYTGDPRIAETIPYRGMRKIIAENVTKSRMTAPHVTLTSEVDMTDAVTMYSALVAEIKHRYGVKITYTDLIVKAVGRALMDHLTCNAALLGDSIVRYSDANIGLAVAADSGLVVPVIKGVNDLALHEVAQRRIELVDRCRKGKQSSEDIS